MNTELEQQKNPLDSYEFSQLEDSQMDERRRHEHRGFCSRLAGLFSALSQNHESVQVAKLREELQRQRDLKATYRARLERIQGYLRYCLDIAQEHGFLHLVSNNEQCSPPCDEECTTTDEPVATLRCDPYLAATRDLAKQNCWFIGPDEVELHERIGQGTTADIYKATWRGLDVAVKWIYPNFFLSNENGESFFAQELDTLSRQRHPYVLRLLGACLIPPENGFIVTELLSGVTLGEWLHGHRDRLRERTLPLPPLKQRIGKGLEIAQALQYLHEQKPKVIHRDLKPSNILLDHSLHVRVADFGHARFLPNGKEALTGETGTYVYMAPEVIRSEPYNEKCDVYSFAIVFNELITGEHPYMETSYGPSKIALEVADGRIRPKLPENDGKCNDLIDLICRMWDADASNRPSFEAITSALREIKAQTELLA